jgi:C-terminal processing protease CtpA/Prc
VASSSKRKEERRNCYPPESTADQRFRKTETASENKQDIGCSPAAQAGILTGDIIVGVAQGPSEAHPDAGLELAWVKARLERPGETVRVLIDRNDKSLHFKLVTRELY